jgi:hypothetical protein
MVAASENTSLRTSGCGSSSNISGGDHGTDMPIDAPVLPAEPVSLSALESEAVCSGRPSSTADEMPKSVRAGQP